MQRMVVVTPAAPASAAAAPAAAALPPVNTSTLHIRFLDTDDRVVIEFQIPPGQSSMNVRSRGVVTSSDDRTVYHHSPMSVAEKNTVVRIDGFQHATSFEYLDLAHLRHLLPMSQWSRDGLIPVAFKHLRTLKLSNYQWVFALETHKSTDRMPFGLGPVVALYVAKASSWQRQHRHILEFVLILASVERMANAYVLLWIANFLPYAHYHVDLRKLRLIEAVIAAQRRVLQRRLTAKV
jgi:hypothetical protein